MQQTKSDARRRRWVLVAAGVLTVALAGAVHMGDKPSASVVWSERDRAHVFLPRGREAPPFVLRGPQAAQVSLAALKGGPVVLAFVTAGCPYCQRLMANLDSLAVPPDRQVVLICRGTQAETDSLAGAHRFPWPVVADTAGATHTAYKISGVPTAYLVDARGRIAAARSGWPAAWELVVQ
ncbi:MAG: TlpA disulfide reductase family protein [Candidatus Latescibacterota bacterium]